jgi:glutamate-5-semialdehyde dehydrogenase
MSAFDVEHSVRAAHAASRVLAATDTSTRNQALEAIATGLLTHQGTIEAANAEDMAAGREIGLSDALLDRLLLNPERIAGMAEMIREVAAFGDPLGEVTESSTRPNGLVVERVRIPLGVIAILYESRPNVTTDAAALCLKSGNAVVLKGGSEAFHSNRALIQICRDALEATGIPADAVTFVDTREREAVHQLLQQDEWVDLVIPRGGEGLIRFVVENSRIPVVQHYKGVCHLFVEESADLERAVDICLNAKAQRPGVCNALETLLIDAPVAERFLALLGPRLAGADVTVHGDPTVQAHLSDAKPASDEDWDTEYLDLILAIRVVDGIDEAIDHIVSHGSGHTDGILTNNALLARTFVNRVDSSAVMVNASTRFNDGNQLGLGAEIGISTSKLHAYGPMGLNELTTRKFVITGNGHIRD